jgi:hypothetical protein
VNLANSRSNVQGVQGTVQGAVQGKTLANTALFKVFKVKSIFFNICFLHIIIKETRTYKNINI